VREEDSPALLQVISFKQQAFSQSLFRISKKNLVNIKIPYDFSNIFFEIWF